MNREPQPPRRRPFLRAWVFYILAFEAVSIPLRLVAVWIATHAFEVGETELRRLEWGGQVLAGLALLPVSFLFYRWSVRRCLCAVPPGS